LCLNGNRGRFLLAMKEGVRHVVISNISSSPISFLWCLTSLFP
jgi:hypothetical protein